MANFPSFMLNPKKLFRRRLDNKYLILRPTPHNTSTTACCGFLQGGPGLGRHMQVAETRPDFSGYDDGVDWNFSAVDSPQTCVDKKIVHLEECLRKLKEERNKMAPISKLPPEILGSVFSFVLEGQPRTLTNFPFPLYYFTHVSRSWRSVGLDTPRLWRVITPLRISWSTVMLERSKATDLIVVSSEQSVDHVSFLRQVLTKHASRVRELKFDVAHFNLSTLVALFGDLQKYTLRLHSLQLISSIWDSYPIFPTGVVEADSLRRLEAHDCDGPWYSMSLRALTTLKLYDINNRPPLVEFLELLRGLTSLQVLEMDNSLPFATDADRASDLIDPIHLPSLQYLSLSSNKNRKEVSNIVSRITVPPTATLIFVTFTEDLEEQINDADALPTSLSAFFSRSHADLSYTSLYIQPVGSPDVTFQALMDGYGNTSKLEVVTALEIDPHTTVPKVFSSRPFFNITALTLEIDLGVSLQNTFGHLPRLREVNVVNQDAVEIIEALTHRCENHDDTQLSDYDSVPFPALEVLSITSGEFGSCPVERFQDCLIERYERGAELLKLEFFDCWELYHSDVEKFREIVVDVGWDGREQGFP